MVIRPLRRAIALGLVVLNYRVGDVSLNYRLEGKANLKNCQSFFLEGVLPFLFVSVFFLSLVGFFYKLPVLQSASVIILVLVFVVGCCDKGVPFHRNIVLAISFLLLLSLFSYYHGIADPAVSWAMRYDSSVREKVFQYGILWVSFFLLGGFFCLKVASKSWRYGKEPRYVMGKNKIGVIFLLALLPLLINMLIYFFVMRGGAYVEYHLQSAGMLGKLMKSVYLTYGAVIYLSFWGYNRVKAYKASLVIWVLFIIVYGLMYKARLHLLMFTLLFLYLYKDLIGWKKLLLGGWLFLFSLVYAEVSRHGSIWESQVLYSLVETILKLGVFPEHLRFVIYNYGADVISFGQHAVGTFLGVSEPLADIYTKTYAMDYYNRGGGYGNFFLAEMLTSFGWLGAPLALFVFGFICTWFSRPCGQSYLAIIGPILFMHSFTLFRNDLGIGFRSILYVFVGVFLIMLIVSFLKVLSRSSALGVRF